MTGETERQIQPAPDIEIQNAANHYAGHNAEGQQEAYQAKPMDGQLVQQQMQDASAPEPDAALWGAVKSNPEDFNSWTELLKLVADRKVIEDIREAFDAFLAEFPLCYGYWKKFAELELDVGGDPERAMHTWERGALAVPHSADYWGLYLAVFIQKNADDDGKVKRLLERAVDTVGLDYASGHVVWDKYLEVEAQVGNWRAVCALYLRILAIPLSAAGRYHKDFQTFVREHPISELLSDEQIVDIDNELAKRIAELDQAKAAAEARSAAATEDLARAQAEVDEAGRAAVAAIAKAREQRIRMLTADCEEGEEPDEATIGKIPCPQAEAQRQAEAEAGLKSARAVLEEAHGSVCSAEAAVEVAKRSKESDRLSCLLQRGGELYKATVAMAEKRKLFEDQIKRTYFHFRPLDEQQLTVWRRYLAFEEGDRQHARIVKLYERCLVACYNYSEFWLRYAHYLDKLGDKEATRAVFVRATTGGVKRRPDVHLAYASFEEAEGRVDVSRITLQNVVSTVAPNMVEPRLRLANLERRLGNTKAAIDVFEEAIARPDLGLVAYLHIHYARFLAQVVKDDTRVRMAYARALKLIRDNRNLVLAAVAFECSRPCPRLEERVVAIFNDALGPKSQFSRDDRAEIFAKYVDVLVQGASNVVRLRQVERQFLLEFPARALGKRAADDAGLTSGSMHDAQQQQQQQQQQEQAAAGDPYQQYLQYYGYNQSQHVAQVHAQYYAYYYQMPQQTGS